MQGSSSYPSYSGSSSLRGAGSIPQDLLTPSSKVLVVGTDGGANFLYIAADRVRELLGVKPANFAVVPVEG